jgi:hypothetical protein
VAQTFLYLRAGDFAVRTAEFYLLLKTPLPQETLSLGLPPGFHLRQLHARGLFALRLQDLASPERLQAKAERWFETQHQRSPIAMVVRRRGRVRLAARHFESVARVSEVLASLQQFARAPGPYLESKDDREHAKVTHFLKDTFWALECGATSAQKEVLFDLFQERLPSLLGAHYGVDLAIRDILAERAQVSPSAVAMPPQFLEGLRQSAENTYARGARPHLLEGPDWTDALAVKAAIARCETRGVLTGLVSAFVETDLRHVAVLAALTSDERLSLAADGPMSLLMANAATFAMMGQDFALALTLYDSALAVRELNPLAAANPLFAVQDDNHHLGVMPERARFYLKKCLPHGPKNPTIELNAAFVLMELEAPDEALAALRRARDGGLNVRLHKNERLFVPLRSRSEFHDLMK